MRVSIEQAAMLIKKSIKQNEKKFYKDVKNCLGRKVAKQMLKEEYCFYKEKIREEIIKLATYNLEDEEEGPDFLTNAFINQEVNRLLNSNLEAAAKLVKQEIKDNKLVKGSQKVTSFIDDHRVLNRLLKITQFTKAIATASQGGPMDDLYKMVTFQVTDTYEVDDIIATFFEKAGVYGTNEIKRHLKEKIRHNLLNNVYLSQNEQRIRKMQQGKCVMKACNGNAVKGNRKSKALLCQPHIDEFRRNRIR